MAYRASDGRKFTNKPPMMAHNRSLERNPMGALGLAERVDPLKQPGRPRHESPGYGNDDHESEAHQVVAEHGPAHEVHVEHDHETGRHTVHSVHEDGHEHDCEHDNVDEAHDHAKALATPQDDADEFEEDAPEYE